MAVPYTKHRWQIPKAGYNIIGFLCMLCAIQNKRNSGIFIAGIRNGYRYNEIYPTEVIAYKDTTSFVTITGFQHTFTDRTRCFSGDDRVEF